MVQYFVDEEIFNDFSQILDVQSVSRPKKLELKSQIRQLEIQERQKEREWEERERRKEKGKEKGRGKKEKEKREKERELEREEREKEREFQLRMREIEMQERANQPKQKIEYNFDVTKQIRLVPPFQEIEDDNTSYTLKKLQKT